MHHLWTDTGWVSDETCEALVSALAAQRGGAHAGLAEAVLQGVFARLGAEARTTAQPPEAVLEVFRTAWDMAVPPHPAARARDLSYYGTLSACLDTCFSARIRELARDSCPQSPR